MLDGEKTIIQDAVKGESSAFGLLYDHYHSQIYRFVFVKVNRREEAEDLTHQVFLSAWKNIGKYQDLGFPFSSWLYRIARNEVIDYYRGHKETMSFDEVDPQIFATQLATSDFVDDKLEMNRVLTAIHKLKSHHQDVLIMRFVEDMALKDVAAALHKSEGAVKLIQHRAVNQLQRILDISHD